MHVLCGDAHFLRAHVFVFKFSWMLKLWGKMSRKPRPVSTSGYFTRNRKVSIDWQDTDRSDDKKADSDEGKKPSKKAKLNVESKIEDRGKCPPNWKEIYDNIVKMRSDPSAAVDTMGCEKCFDRDIDDKTRRFQVLVSLMLSSQTKDQ